MNMYLFILSESPSLSDEGLMSD